MQLSDVSTKLPEIARKRSFWLYVGLFFLAYALFLLMSLPAAHLFPANKSDPNSLKIGQIQGTAWQGGIGWARLQELSATKIEWDFNPWALFGGAWEYAVDFELDNIPVTAYVAKNLSGTWRVSDAVAGLKLQDTPYVADNLSGVLPGKLQGDLAVRLEEMLWFGEWPQSIRGTFLLQDLKLGELPALGDWEGRAYQEGSNIILAFTPRGRMLQGKGQLVLSPDRQWNFILQLKAGEVIDQELAGWLSLLGAPDAEGYHRIQRSGRLK